MQLYEDSRINNDIRNTYEYPTIKNLLISTYKVDAKNASAKAQSLASKIINDKTYQELKAKKQTNNRDVSSDNYLKKYVQGAMSNYKGKVNITQPAQPQSTAQTENANTTQTAQPQQNSNITNKENVELLNILNANQPSIYNSVLSSPNEIQYLSLDDSGKVSFNEEDFKKEESSVQQPSTSELPPKNSGDTTPSGINETLRNLGIRLPEFLSRYLEANNKNTAFYSILNPEISSKLKAENINILGIYKDPKTKKWIAIDSSGKKLDISQLKNEDLNNEKNLYDIKIEDSDINAIEKEILPIIQDKEVIEGIKLSITDIKSETPFNLKLQLGKPLKESFIQRYRINESEKVLSDIGGSKQFYILFEMSSNQKIKEAEEEEDKKSAEGTDNQEKKEKSSVFSEIDEKQLVNIVRDIREGLLAQLEKKHKLKFKLSKKVNLKSSDTREMKMTILISEGNDSYISASKTDNVISGKFTLKATLDKSKTKFNLDNLVNNLENTLGSKVTGDNAGVTL